MTTIQLTFNRNLTAEAVIARIVSRLRRDRRDGAPQFAKAVQMGRGTVVVPVSFTVCGRRKESAVVVEVGGEGDAITVPNYPNQLECLQKTILGARAVFN